MAIRDFFKILFFRKPSHNKLNPDINKVMDDLRNVLVSIMPKSFIYLEDRTLPRPSFAVVHDGFKVFHMFIDTQQPVPDLRLLYCYSPSNRKIFSIDSAGRYDELGNLLRKAIAEYRNDKL